RIRPLLMSKLENRYDNLGLSIDETTGKVIGLADANEVLSKKMKGAMVTHLEKVISDLTKEVDKLRERHAALYWSVFKPFRGGTLKRVGQEFHDALDKLSEYREELKRLQEVEKEGEDETDIRARILAEQRAKQEASELTLNWERKIAELKIQGIENEAQRSLAAIDLRYDYEVEKAADNVAAIDLMDRSRILELQYAMDKATKIQQELEKTRLTAVESWEMKIARIKIRGIEDEKKRRLAEMDLRYKYERKKIKENADFDEKTRMDLLARVLKAQVLEKELIETGRLGEKEDTLPEAIEKGTAEAYSAIVKQEQPAVKETAKNTRESVRQQKRTNELIEKTFGFFQPTTIDLGL
ncbi:unnamed protein product, partial [marine sediment metagenome]